MAQRTGALIFDEHTDRYDIRFDIADYYGGLHCGECMEVFTGGKWKPMTAHNGNTEQDERGLLPYPVIIAATKGDPEAMKVVVQHYESYIASLSMRKLIDERGNTYYGIDEDIRDRLRSKLMRAVLSFKV